MTTDVWGIATRYAPAGTVVELGEHLPSHLRLHLTLGEDVKPGQLLTLDPITGTLVLLRHNGRPL